MKNYLLFGLLILFCHKSFAQIDTVFLDKSRKKVDNLQDASYYQIIKPQDSIFMLTEYYLNGKIKMEATLSSLKPQVFDGIAAWYSEDGVLTSKGFYKGNRWDGPLISYYPDGTIKSEAVYKADIMDGEYKFYYPNKQLKRVDIYKEGVFTSGKCYTSTGDEKPYYPYLQDPEFEGGTKKLQKYITTKLIYPENVRRQEIEGIVRVNFIVTTAGDITDVRLVNTVHPLLDNQALELVKNMPRWNPGLEDNEKAAFSLTLPIAFKLTDGRKHRKGL